jgi:hypothetical protein
VVNEVLHYRRQFFITIAPASPPAKWKHLQLSEYHIYAHPDLEVNRLVGPNRTVVLFGDIYDYEEPQKQNVDILEDIMSGPDHLNLFISQMKRYFGCYALFLKSDHEAIILHDARGLREIYYCTETNHVLCGSQPNLLFEYSNPEIKTSRDRDLIDFYDNHLWDSRWIGDETPFAGIKHLLPNHYLDINKRKAFRFWPSVLIKNIRLEDAVYHSSIFLKGAIKAIVHRHPVMMGVTAGTDSRILLAASRDVHDKIYYFVNNQGLGSSHPDISVPIEIFKSLGIPFHVHDVPIEVDDEFRKAYFHNTFFAAERILPSIYNVFFKEHGEKSLILGVSEIGRNFYGREPKQLDGFRMACTLGYPESRYIIRQCEHLVPILKSVAKQYGINAMTLLYWEQRLGNWGAVRNSESLIAIEKIDPFNSHLLYEIFLGVDEKYRYYLDTPCVLCAEMIRSLWPGLLNWPINPTYTIHDKLIWLLAKAKLYGPLKELKYQAIRLKHIIRGRS